MRELWKILEQIIKTWQNGFRQHAQICQMRMACEKPEAGSVCTKKGPGVTATSEEGTSQ